jgi:hypothetical protein
MRVGIGSRLVASRALVAIVTLGVALAFAAAAPSGPAPGAGARTQITVWSATVPPSGAFGGLEYGGYPPTTGAMITERREVDIIDGEARIAGVPATLDPGSVQLRDVTDANALITEQRFVAGATTPTELLVRHVGDAITVLTQKAEVSGTLRSVDDQVIVVEVGTGDQRRLQMMRRDGYVQDIRLPTGAASDQPSLVWRVRTATPGKHTVEVSYRANGLSWNADYLAVLDDAGKALEFSAWATIKNASGASYHDAAVTLVANDAPPGGIDRGTPPPLRFAVPAQVRIGRAEAVQVELVKPRVAVSPRAVVTYEAMPDPSGGFQTTAAVDCNQQSGVAVGGGRAEAVLELDLPAHTALPDGKVRLFRRSAGRLEVVSEDALRPGSGVVRIRVAAATDITGDRHAVTCNYDERARTIRETIELRIDSKAKQTSEVVIREFLWRWPVSRVEAETVPGVRAGPQLQEYRTRVPAGGRQVMTYTVVYTW